MPFDYRSRHPLIAFVLLTMTACDSGRVVSPIDCFVVRGNKTTIPEFRRLATAALQTKGLTLLAFGPYSIDFEGYPISATFGPQKYGDIWAAYSNRLGEAKIVRELTASSSGLQVVECRDIEGMQPPTLYLPN